MREAGGYHVYDDLGYRTPNISIDIDQDRANSLGITNQQIGQISQAAFGGVRITELREGDHIIPVVVRLRIEERNEAEKIRALYIHSADQPAGAVRQFRRRSRSSRSSTRSSRITTSSAP